MRNVFYKPEYAQHLEREQLRAELEQLLMTSASPAAALEQLDDESLLQMVVALEQTRKALCDKQNVIRSQQYRTKQQFQRLYGTPDIMERITKKRPIEDLKDFPFRVYTLLKRAGIVTVYDLCSKSREELSVIFRRNRRFLADVEAYLSDIGLKLYGAGSVEGTDPVQASESDIRPAGERKPVDFFGTAGV